LSFLPTEEKLRSLNSAKRGSVAVVRWCFFLLSLFTVTTGIGFAAETAEVEALAAFAGVVVGGVSKDNGNSTWEFLMPMSSSTRPSYVSCVRSGVIMSTRRSRTIKESIFDVDDCRPSGLELLMALGFWRVKRVASRWA